MIQNFKYGFEYKGFKYGWLKKELYRLPSQKHRRHYGLRKLPIIKVGNKDGYRVVRDRFTIDQLMNLTERIDYRHVVNGAGSDDCPY